MSKIEEIISEIELYLDNCKPQAFSGNKKVIVEKDVMDEMLAELRMRTPEEIKKYQKIISNKEAIMEDAQKTADHLIAEANLKTEAMVADHEITQLANKEAQEIIESAQVEAQRIVDNAVNDANSIRTGAMEYTDAILKNVQTILAHSIEDSQNRFDAFVDQLKASYEVVTANREELSAEAPMEDEYGIDISMTTPEEN